MARRIPTGECWVRPAEFADIRRRNGGAGASRVATMLPPGVTFQGISGRFGAPSVSYWDGDWAYNQKARKPGVSGPSGVLGW